MFGIICPHPWLVACNLGASLVSCGYAPDSLNLKLHNRYCYSAQRLVGQGGPKKLFLDFQKLLDVYDFEVFSNTCYLITNDFYKKYE